MTPDGAAPLFSVRDLEKHYPVTEGFLRTEVGHVRAVDGISFDLYPGDSFGIVGESGCGKTTAALAMTRLREPTGGEITYRGRDVTAFDRAALKRFRREVQVVFQDPDSSLDPRMSVGDALAEPLVVQGMADADRREDIVADLLERVGLAPDDAERYPHEFSGGQKQRLGIARALAVNPDVIIADEPVSALDVSVKAEILALMRRLQAAHDLTIVVISHDLGVVRELCDRVAVMYLGEFVEVGPTDELFEEPMHPYTRALLAAIPVPDPNRDTLGVELEGDVPDPASPPSGCRFHPRCPEVIQPAGRSLDRASWRALLAFRRRLRAGREATEPLLEVAREDPEALRRELGLAETLADADAERAVDQAIARLAEADVEGALAAFDGVLDSPCISHRPQLLDQAPGRQVACHLHTSEPTDRDRPADP